MSHDPKSHPGNSLRCGVLSACRYFLFAAPALLSSLDLCRADSITVSGGVTYVHPATQKVEFYGKDISISGLPAGPYTLEIDATRVLGAKLIGAAHPTLLHL